MVASSVSTLQAGASPVPERVLIYEVREVESGRLLFELQGWHEAVTGDDELIAAVARTVFPQGSVVQSRAILTRDDPPRCVSWSGVTRDPTGAVVASTSQKFTADALPFLLDPLPPDTYPPEAPLGYVISRLHMGRRREKASFHMLFTGSTLVRMDLWTEEKERVEVPAGTFDSYRIRMRPDPESLFPGLPGFVRAFASFFIPTQTMWFTDTEPQMLLRFRGHMGPPGSPEMEIRLVRVSEGKAPSSARPSAASS